MANSLEVGTTPPPAPLQDAPQNSLQQQGAAQSSPPAGAPQAAPAPPTHQQTVAALRHFDMIKGELMPLLKDPTLGKSDLKSKIIDGVTKLVSERVLAPAQAVMQLSQVPSDPIQQRKWLQTQMAQTMQAENAILDHYGAGNPSMHGNPQDHMSESDHGSRDDHMGHMAALAANYGGGAR
jgi:hypothetical protein